MSGIRPFDLAELVLAHSRNDQASFSRIVNDVIHQCLQSGNSEMATNLQMALDERQNFVSRARAGDRSLPSLLKQLEGHESYCYQVHKAPKLADLTLTESVHSQFQELVRELAAKDRLIEHSLEPVRTLLMHGPPGNGKTVSASAIATELKLPFFVLRVGGLRSKWVGETGARISQVFRAFQGVSAVLFLDECDALMGHRMSDSGGSQAKAEDVNVMLTCLDECSPQTYVFGATNRLDMIDEAARRRFELKIELPKPHAEGLAAWFRQFVESRCDKFEVNLDPDEVGAAAEQRSDSFALLEQRCMRALRTHVIEMPDSDLTAQLAAKLEVTPRKPQRASRTKSTQRVA